MSTRAMIYVLEDGKLSGNYCHYDNYLLGTGALLKNCLKNKEDVLDLIKAPLDNVCVSDDNKNIIPGYTDMEYVLDNEYFDCKDRYESEEIWKEDLYNGKFMEHYDFNWDLSDVHIEEFTYIFDADNNKWYVNNENYNKTTEFYDLDKLFKDYDYFKEFNKEKYTNKILHCKKISEEERNNLLFDEFTTMQKLDKEYQSVIDDGLVYQRYYCEPICPYSYETSDLEDLIDEAEEDIDECDYDNTNKNDLER